MPSQASVAGCMMALALAVPAVAGDIARSKQIDMARGFGKLLANGGPDRVAETGLLVLSVDWIDKRWIGREPPPTEFSVELSATNGGPAGTIDLALGKPGIGDLPAGRHCISGLRSASSAVRLPCEAPYFDVSARSVDIGGHVEIEVKGSKGRIAWRDVGGKWNQLGLSPAQEAVVAGFLGRAQGDGYRTYFLSMPLAPPRIVRLRPDGSAEYEEHSLANASYTRGTWQAGDGIEARFQDDRTRLRWADAGDHPRVHDLWWHRNRDGLPLFALEQQWAATTRIACWDWRACGRRIGPGMVISPEFGKVGIAKPLQGRITLAFDLRADRDTYQPDEVAIVESTLDAVTSREIAIAFSDARFLVDPTWDAATSRWTQAVEFQPDGDRIHATYGDLVAARRSAEETAPAQ